MGMRIKGTGHYVPDRVLTNADLEKMVDTSDEWIVTRTGIKMRHIATPEQATSDLACEAAKRALDNAGISAKDIDLIIMATSTPDKLLPNTAAIIQHKLGAPCCPCFDIETACTGLLYSINIAHAMMLANPGYKHVLICAGDKLSAITNWKDRSTCVLFGDAACALVLEQNVEIPYDFLLAGKIDADGSFEDILQVPAGGTREPASQEAIDEGRTCIKMNGPKTFQKAVSTMCDACRSLLDITGVNPQKIRWAIPHQANSRIISAVVERMGMSEQLYMNVDRFGNTSAASIGICLDELNRAGKLSRGDLVMTASFGAGLTWAAALLRW